MTVNEIERRNFFSRLENESQPLKINEIKHENVVYMQIASKININFFKGNKKYKAEILFEKIIDGENAPEINFVLLNEKELNGQTILTEKDYSLLFDAVKESF